MQEEYTKAILVNNGQQRTRPIWLSLAGVVVTLGMLVAMVIVMNFHQQAARATTGDWPMFLNDLGRSGYNSMETAINPASAASLKLNWKYTTNGDISSQPIVANGQVYWGSWDGNEYATDLTGKKIWSASIGGQTQNCAKSRTYGVASSASVADLSINGTMTTVVFVGGQDPTTKTANLYALNAADGSIIWKTLLSSSAASFTWASPVVYSGSVYIGLSSADDCPLVQGALLQLNATTGVIQNTFDVVPNSCLGGSIWSSPTIDAANNAVYVTTGNKGSCKSTENYVSAIVKLDASTLSVLDSWQVPAAEQVTDGDFGATPTLFTASYGGSTHQMVGAQNKNGTYYAFDRTSLSGGPVWRAKLSTNNSSIDTSSWDGTSLYVGSRDTTINSKSCKGSLRSLNPATGSFNWQVCLNDGPVLAPISAVPGVAFVGEGPHVLAVATASGNILFNYKTSGNINGSASISNGVLYVGDASGNLYTFGVPSTSTPTPTSTNTPTPTSTSTATPTVTPSTTPGATLGQDNFQRPNQTHWGTASDGQTWGADANNLSNFSINNNTGQITGSGSNGATYSGVLGPTASDAEVVVAGSISSFGTNTFGAALRWSSSNNFYKAYITGTNLVISKKVNGTVTKLKSVAFTAKAGTSYTIDFSVVGTTLSAKVWQTGTTPPSSWMVTTTDSSLSSGNCGIVVFLQKNINADFTSFLATQLS